MNIELQTRELEYLSEFLRIQMAKKTLPEIGKVNPLVIRSMGIAKQQASQIRRVLQACGFISRDGLSVTEKGKKFISNL